MKEFIQIATGSFLLDDIIGSRRERYFNIEAIILQILIWIIFGFLYTLLGVFIWIFSQWISVQFIPVQYQNTVIEGKYIEHVDDTYTPMTTYINNMPVTTMQFIPGYDAYELKLKDFSKSFTIDRNHWNDFYDGMKVKVGYKKSKGGLVFFQNIIQIN